MRVLLLLLAPFMAYTQVDTVLTYHVKEVHYVTFKDTAATEKIDTTKFQSVGEIKFTKSSVSIDGYSKYKILSYQMNGDSVQKFPYYYFSNGMYLIWFTHFVILEYPFKNNKSTTVIFMLDSPMKQEVQ